MRTIAKLSCVAGLAAALAMSISAANAQSRYSSGRDYVYGANHAPYGSDEDNPRDFQLQGR
jgi:hypothetical protein